MLHRDPDTGRTGARHALATRPWSRCSRLACKNVWRRAAAGCALGFVLGSTAVASAQDEAAEAAASEAEAADDLAEPGGQDETSESAGEDEIAGEEQAEPVSGAAAPAGSAGMPAPMPSAAPGVADSTGSSGGGSRTPIFFGLLAALFLLVSALAGANDKHGSAPPV